MRPMTAARAIISRESDKKRASRVGRVNINWVTTITENGTTKPRKRRRCREPGYLSCKILRWMTPSIRKDFILCHILSDLLSLFPMRQFRVRLLKPHEKIARARRIKNTSNVLTILI
jgi:hypothetical protein